MNALTIEVMPDPVNNLSAMLKVNAEIHDKSIHHNLQANLVEHIRSKIENRT